MWELIVVKGFNTIAAELNALGMVIFALFLWTKFEQYTQRKRMGVVLDAKDAYNKEVVGQTLAMAKTTTKLTDLLEEIVRRQRNEASRQD